MENEKVLAFRRELLEQVGYFNGISFEVNKYLAIFKDPNNLVFIDRHQAEKDPLHKQIIPYSILAYKDQILFYRRSKKADIRLQRKASIGVGGHINPEDAPNLSEWETILMCALKRELSEEFYLSGSFNISQIALINDDSNEVGSVHFGIVNLIDLNGRTISIRDAEIERCEFLGIDEIKLRREDLESWSRICLDLINWRKIRSNGVNPQKTLKNILT